MSPSDIINRSSTNICPIISLYRKRLIVQTHAFLKKWFLVIVNWTRELITPSQLAWKWATNTIITFGLVFILAEFYSEILHPYSSSKLLGFLVNLILPMLMGVGFYFGLHLIKRTPKNTIWAIILLVPFSVGVLDGIWGGKGSVVFIGTSLFALTLTVGSGAVLFKGGFKFTDRKKAFSFFLIGLLCSSIIFYNLFGAQDYPNPNIKTYQLADMTLPLSDPSLPGTFKVKNLTYGSGTDLHRLEYGKDVDIKTTSVNGNHLVDRWSGPVGWARTLFWGFDDKTLPRQGRVWMPEGDGPFPLILIVHGNHGMEDFSDPGYAYLGELLASRGNIFVSVDENFINSSWADVIHPFKRGIGRENDARGWMLLEHLSLWRDWMADESSPLYGKADMERIALMGHSRGGEAVGIAAAFNELSHYPDDATLAFDYGFSIKGVIAIAPVDGQYRPRNRPTPLNDINYFTIHGSGDGDVDSFAGSAQYARNAFSGNNYRFKSSLYIHEANHGQFNTGWGRNDFGGFSGWFLDTKNLISGENQRQVARVYFSAFLEVTLNNRIEYLPIFKDARYAKSWLPNNYYINNFNDSNEVVLANFDEDIKASTGTLDGTIISAKNLSQWKERWIKMIYDDNDTQVLKLAWNKKAHKEFASYELNFGAAGLSLNENNILTFAASHAGNDTLPKDFDKRDEDKDDKSLGLDWSIILTDVNGKEASVQLSQDHLLFKQIKTQTRRLSFLFYLPDSEAIMRHFSYPLAKFKEVTPALDLAQLQTLRFKFDKSDKGAIYLDDIGFSKK